MKRLLTALSLSAAAALGVAAQGTQNPPPHQHGHEAGKHEQHKEGHGRSAPSEQTANVNLTEGQVVRRGEAIGESPAVKFADVLSEPQKYAGKKVVVEGVVERVCQKQACWMEIAPEKGARGVRVEFGDHAFFVPFNSAGLHARAEGTFAVKQLTSAEADHLEKEGARHLRRDKDGEATEISFVATGVELRK
ncbi:MAG TPA: DUF4920 domain-containing protein [Pyrinomonadaceae bacterium]|nr:DUF4920 domain-containing protein [Pyrinomonadaceae bacterium]